jgi:glycosyltransferase involved in cell wall biosynthesis
MNKTKQATVLFLLHLPPPIHGSSVVGKIINDSELINKTYKCSYINLLVSRTVDETGKAGLVKVIRFIGVWFKLLIQLIKEKPNVCYLALTTTGAAFYKDVLLVALLRMFRVKRVYHLHNKGVSNYNNSKIHSYFYQFVFNNADVILLSQFLYKDVEKFVPTSQVHICPNGIDETRHKNQEPRIKTKGEIPTILFLSNLIESKGVYVLVEACEILQKRAIEFKCNFIGGEGDVSSTQLNAMIKQKGLSGHVYYLGKKYGDEKNQYFKESDIFVLPTYYKNETFGLVNLEAMQYSLPVVSTFEGGIPDVVEDGVTGFLVPQCDAEALADKLEILIKDKALRQKMGEAGRIKYENEFTLEIFENRLVEIINTVVS